MIKIFSNPFSNLLQILGTFLAFLTDIQKEKTALQCGLAVTAFLSVALKANGIQEVMSSILTVSTIVLIRVLRLLQGRKALFLRIFSAIFRTCLPF